MCDIEDSGKSTTKNDIECLICTKEFDTAKQCHDHYKTCKTSLTCKKCHQKFDKLHTYDAHVSMCDGLDRYKCSGCGLSFIDHKKAYNHIYNCKKN